MKSLIIFFMLFSSPLFLFAQPSWERASSEEKTDLELFRATMTAHFPTTETLQKGDFEYEISHRFIPPVNEGMDANFGFDGPVTMRMGLSYGLTDVIMINLSRSNILDNVELSLKYKFYQFENELIPAVCAFKGGIAFNTETPESFDNDITQYFAQLVMNTMFFDKKLGIGLVPSYLYNSNIFTVDKQYTFTLGNYIQYYYNTMWSARIEYNPIIAGYIGFVEPEQLGQRSYNSVSFVVDLETGGHVFQFIFSNNVRLNASQYLVGAERKASSGDWSFGFGITRHL